MSLYVLNVDVIIVDIVDTPSFTYPPNESLVAFEYPSTVDRFSTVVVEMDAPTLVLKYGILSYRLLKYPVKYVDIVDTAGPWLYTVSMI